MEKKEIIKELKMHNLPSKGSIGIMRTRLELHIKKLLPHPTTNTINLTKHKTTQRLPPSTDSTYDLNTLLQPIHTTLANMENSIRILSDRIDIPILSETRKTTTDHPKSPHKLSQNTATLAHTSKELEITTRTITTLIESSEKAITKLSQSIKDTQNMKAELDKWHQSIFHSEDSEKIDKIHETLCTTHNENPKTISTLNGTVLPHIHPSRTQNTQHMYSNNTPAPMLTTEINNISCPPQTTPHIDNVTPNFIPPTLANHLTEFLSTCRFSDEGGHGTITFGQPYTYRGSQNHNGSTIMPEILQQVANMIQFPVNLCLINRYTGANSFLPEHADNEPCIYPNTKICTVSLGQPGKITFRNIHIPMHIEHLAMPNSLYTMSKES